jgi:hypothetical protein
MDGSSCRFVRVRSRPAKTIKGAQRAAYYPEKRFYPRSLARRLASPLFLPVASSYHDVLAVAQQAKSNVARAEAEAPRPGESEFYAALRLALRPFFAPFSVLASPLGGTAAAEGHDAVSALGMDGSSCGFNYQGHEEDALLPADAVLSAEPNAAPRVAPLPAGRLRRG